MSAAATAVTAPRPMREMADVDPRALPASLLESAGPVVVRGLAASWPAVMAARESPARASAYLLSLYRGMKVTVLSAPPSVRGRFFYDETLAGFNFRRAKTTLDGVLADLKRAASDPDPPAIYVGSTAIEECLPGFRAANDFGFGARDPYVSLWLGNRTRIAAHHDLPTNLACVVAGRRRFTLFPPEQLANLYVGPLEFTPAGQPVSLVDFANPDLAKHPRFAEALAHAQVAELAPGDAILIPSLWWHHIEGLDDLNVLVNYWWRRTPAFLGPPIAALLHAILSIRDLPPEQREAWREMFRHYVFDTDAKTAAHIPEARRGVLGPIDEAQARALREAINRLLNQ